MAYSQEISCKYWQIAMGWTKMPNYVLLAMMIMLVIKDGEII
jgi:hypothetical protein